MGQGTRPSTPKGRRPAALSLTADERRHLGVSLRNLRRAYGSWACLADAMGGVHVDTLRGVAYGRIRSGSPAIALAAARAGHTTVEAVLTGKLTDAARCHSCGSTLSQRAAAAGGAR